MIRGLFKSLALLVVVVGSVVALQAGASALPECDLKSIELDSVHYDECKDDAAPVDCNATTVLVGSANEEKVYNYLTKKGLSPQQAAGVMGNLSVESNFVPNNQQNGSTWPTGGWGIAQWTGSRRDTLAKEVLKADLVYSNDDDANDPKQKLTAKENDALLAFQLDFLFQESNERTMRDNPAKAEWAGLKDVTTVKDAVIYWEYNFERAGVPALGQRLEDANAIFAKYGSGGSESGASGGVLCGEGGEVIDGWSLPVDRKWYDQNPTWFTKPHHDYPSADIPVPEGTPVYSMTAGVVTKAPITTEDKSYGQGVEIRATDGSIFIYGHGIDGGAITGAKVGDTVSPGQLIMHSDTTGNSDGYHLHLEIHLPNGTNVCPQNLLVGIATNQIPSLSSLPSSGCTY